MSGVIAHAVANLSDSGYYFAFFQDEDGVEYLRIVLGLGILAAIFHLLLLVMACLEIKGRSSRRSVAPEIIYVQGAPNDIREHQPQMESWQESSPPAYSPIREGQTSLQQFDDQIRHSEPGTAAAVLPEKKP
ncbi:Fc.00g058170.m01.CDS01 [Cosmosporella sp. VM-42]